MNKAIRLALIAASVSLAGGPRWAVAAAHTCTVEAPATLSAPHVDRADGAAVRDGADTNAPVPTLSVAVLPGARGLPGADRTAHAVAIAHQLAPVTHHRSPTHDARGPPLV